MFSKYVFRHFFQIERFVFIIKFLHSSSFRGLLQTPEGDEWYVGVGGNAEAIDRVHRVGQTRPIEVVRLLAVNTVEHKILKLQVSDNRKTFINFATGREQVFTIDQQLIIEAFVLPVVTICFQEKKRKLINQAICTSKSNSSRDLEKDMKYLFQWSAAFVAQLVLGEFDIVDESCAKKLACRFLWKELTRDLR